MAFVLILLGVGVKAELFLVNSWVPEVYATAPGWVSGLLAGMVSKLAILVLLRLLILVFDFPDAHNLLLLLGVAGFVSGNWLPGGPGISGGCWRFRPLASWGWYSSVSASAARPA